MSKALDGKVALITGSGRGIGRAIALKLAGEGARIVVNDLDEEPARETVQAVRNVGSDAAAIIALLDVAQPCSGRVVYREPS